MNDSCRPLVLPARLPKDPQLPRTVVIASVEPDVGLLAGELFPDGSSCRRMVNSRLYLAEGAECALAGPVMGAPYAAFILETLVAWGAREVVFAGWCGSISPRARVGSLLVPPAAFIDEGTSRHYLEMPDHPPKGPEPGTSAPDPALAAALAREAADAENPCLERPLWTTDAVFCETPEKVQRFSGLGAAGVDMETSALFTVARHRGVPLAAVCVVSDELFSGSWKPGFKDKRFSAGRRRAAAAVCRLLRSGSWRKTS